MEYLIDLLNRIGGGAISTQWLFSATVGLAVALFALGVLLLATSGFDPLQRRLRQLVGHPAGGGMRDGVERVMEPLAPYVMPRSDKERSNARQLLLRAGYYGPNVMTTYYATKLLLGLALPVVVLMGSTWYPRFNTIEVVMVVFGAALVGSWIPSAFVRHRAERRQRNIMNGFPDALDLLVACTEAGLGLNAAIQRVARELDSSYPELAQELALVTAQIRAGMERVEALRELAARTGLDEIRGLVSLLSQSLRFGTSVADSLRIYAEEFRDRRMQRAEERAAKIGTKMIFPLVLCLFPSFFLIAIGPAILGVIRAFAG